MEPITALGAASSVVGIAGFALDLSVGLFKVASQIRSASDSIKGLGDTVKSTAFALEQIEKLLKEEEGHLQQIKTLRIFSVTGLLRVKETTSQCLKLLWKIEAVAIGSEEPDEVELGARLARLASATSKSIQLDPRFTSPSVGFWDRLVFAVSTSDKLKEYGRQLQNYQISLSLIFDVVTLTYLLSKNSLTDTDQKAIATANEDLHRPRVNVRQVAESVLHGNDVSEPTPLPLDTRGPEAQHCNIASVDSGPENSSEDVGANMFLFQTPTMVKEVPRSQDQPLPRAAYSKSPAPTATATGVRSLDGREDGTASFTRPKAATDKTFVSQASGNAGYSRNNSLFGPKIRGGMAADSSTDPVEESDLMKVYTLQRHREWREEKLTYAEVLQRLAKLDQGSQTALDKKLRLSLGQQRKVDAIQAQVNEDEDEKLQYRWSLRQLELIKGKLSRLRGFMAIVVYLQRENSQLRQLKSFQRAESRNKRANIWENSTTPVSEESDVDYRYMSGIGSCLEPGTQAGYGGGFGGFGSLHNGIGTNNTAGIVDIGRRRKVAKAFGSVGNRLSTPAPDTFDDSAFSTWPAADFPTIPAEEQMNHELPMGSYNPSRNSDGDPVCFSCGGVGHTSRDCATVSQRPICRARQDEPVSASLSEELTPSQQHVQPPPQLQGDVGSIVDSGMMRNAFGFGQASSFNSQALPLKDNAELSMEDGTLEDGTLKFLSDEEQSVVSLPPSPQSESGSHPSGLAPGLRQDSSPTSDALPPVPSAPLPTEAQELLAEPMNRMSSGLSNNRERRSPRRAAAPSWTSPPPYPYSQEGRHSQIELLDDAIITQLMSLLTPAKED